MRRKTNPSFVRRIQPLSNLTSSAEIYNSPSTWVVETRFHQFPNSTLSLSLSLSLATMATPAAERVSDEKPNPFSATAVETAAAAASTSTSRLLSSYLGVSFAVFLGFLPRASLSYLPSIQSRNRILTLKLFQAEDQLRQLRSRRREDAKANARVAEIFAGHRHAWHQEERRLVHQLSAADDEIAALKARISDLEKTEADLRSSIKKLEKEVSERDEMLDFMARKAEGGGHFTEKEKDLSLEEEGLCADFSAMGGKIRVSEEGLDPVVPDGSFLERNSELDEMVALYARQNSLGRDFLPPPAAVAAWKPWTDRSAGWEVKRVYPLVLYYMLNF